MAQNTSPWSDWTAPTAGTLGGFNPNTAMFGSKRDALNTNDAMAIMSGDKRRMAQLGIRHAGDPFAFTRESMAARADTAGRMALGQQQWEQQRMGKQEDFLYKMAGETGVFDVKGALDAKRAQNEQDLKAKALGIQKTQQDMSLAASERPWKEERYAIERQDKLDDEAVARAHGMNMVKFQADVNSEVSRLVRDGFTPEEARAEVRLRVRNEAAKLAQDVAAGAPGSPGGPELSKDGNFYKSNPASRWARTSTPEESLLQRAMRGGAAGQPSTPATQPAAPAKMSPYQRSQAEQFIKANANATDPKVKAQVEGWRRALAAQGA